MTSAPPSTATDKDTLFRRIVVTLCALTVFRIGQWIPLPGLDLAALGHSQQLLAVGSPRAMTSIMALGIAPLLTVLILAESAMCASMRLRRWTATPAGHARWRAAIVGALVLAGLQAYGVSSSLATIPGLVVAPGWQFYAGAVTSFLGATLIVVLLASWITTHGIGPGIWVLFGAIQAEAFIQPLLAQLPLLAMGALSPENFLGNVALRFAVLAAATAVLATLVKARPPLSDAPELIWTPLVAGLVVSLSVGALLILQRLLFPAGSLDITAQFAADIYLPLLAIAVAVVLLARRKSFLAPGQRLDVVAAVPVIAALVLFCGLALALPYARSACLLAVAGLLIAEAIRPAARPAGPPLARE